MLRALSVATHNIMNGIKLTSLLKTYRRHQRHHGLHLFFVQEGVVGTASAIVRCLGSKYEVARHAATPRLLIIFDRTVLRLRLTFCIKMPRIEKVPLWQRLYTGLEQKYALAAQFTTARGSLTVANFHLDAAGDNTHRRSQMQCLSRFFSSRAARFSHRMPIIACGDTNAFTWQRSYAESELKRVIEPLCRQHSVHDAHASCPRDNHFFARADEPRIGQRIAVFVGKFGVDFPRRYNVICSSLKVARHGSTETPSSDHDLVWAHLGVPKHSHVSY